MSVPFKPIRPKKISEEIIEQIKALISSGELRPGQRIPSERELSALLGVSRPSVREAIMVLDGMGILESRQGGGTFVRSMAESALVDPLTSMVGENPRLLFDLAEVRMGLESWSVYLAAQRATDEELDQMRTHMAQMEAQAASGGWNADVDAKFHYSITAASHNTLQVHVLDTIHSLFHKTIQVALTEFYQKEGYVELLLEQHRAILTAIEQRDADGARDAMLKHLSLVKEKMLQLKEQESKD